MHKIDCGATRFGALTSLAMPLSASERRMRARKAALTSWARTEDRSARARRGHDGLLRKFEDEVDPNGTLSQNERRTRAQLLLDAHMEGLRLKASKARRA
jgi:hypothetical protein